MITDQRHQGVTYNCSWCQCELPDVLRIFVCHGCAPSRIVTIRTRLAIWLHGSQGIGLLIILLKRSRQSKWRKAKKRYVATNGKKTQLNLNQCNASDVQENTQNESLPAEGLDVGKGCPGAGDCYSLLLRMTVCPLSEAWGCRGGYDDKSIETIIEMTIKPWYDGNRK
ncbi:hypothetical protein BS17DRAFT_769521 [Gyrodon lividus]|nr:hypothetical protein BS17DRAFT_769521 [Gyrodon lividus]